MLKMKSGSNTSDDHSNDPVGQGHESAGGAVRPSILSALKSPDLFPSDEKVPLTEN